MNIGKDIEAIIERARMAHEELHRSNPGWEEDMAAAEQAGLQAAQRKRLLDFARAAEIPELCVRLFLGAGPRRNQAIEAVQRTGLPRVVILSGASSTGKSVAAYWAAWNACRRATGGKPPAICADAADLVRLSMRERERFEAACTRQLLVLDDLGWEYRDDKGFALSVLGRLLDRREKACLPMIATTNLLPHPSCLDAETRTAQGRAPTLYERLGGNDIERERNWRRIGGDVDGALVMLWQRWDA